MNNDELSHEAIPTQPLQRFTVQATLRVAHWRLMRIDEVWYFVCETCGYEVRKWPGDDAPKQCDGCAALVGEGE